MYRAIQYVAIAERTKGWGNGKCVDCGHRVWKGWPSNYPQVCHECADKTVWHYCDRPRKAAPAATGD